MTLNGLLEFLVHFLELNIECEDERIRARLIVTLRMAKAPASIFICRIFSFRLTIFSLDDQDRCFARGKRGSLTYQFLS